MVAVSSIGEERLGEVIGKRYELRAVLGHGGQSVLYRAKDRVDGDEVALKMVRDGQHDPDAVERMFREAQALAQLAGTAALRVLHQLRADDGTMCLVTELLRGQNLNERLVELESAGERMARGEIIETFAPIVRTIDVANERGILHRDIKPENIFVIHAAWGGGVRLLDFGFVRFVRGMRLTAQGMVAGSPSHLAPEVWMGQEIDSRSDVYSLAVVLFRVLGGKPPFAGTPYELLKQVTAAPRPSLRALRPELPPAIDDWVAHALAIPREDRFQRAAAMWNALLGCLSALPG
jgi:serine/threonine-protein kinase